jgi:hypothetical protein
MGKLIGSSSDDGQSNTSLIISGCGSPNIAARICANLVIDGYDDWYLPSFTELYTLYEALYLNGNPGNFQPANYWSSREDGENFAYPYDFSTGFYYSTQKSVQYRVRAIRKF